MTLRLLFTAAQALTFVGLAAVLFTEGGLANVRLAVAQMLLAIITVVVYL